MDQGRAHSAHAPAPSSGPTVDHYVVSARAVSENLYRTRFVVAGNTRSVTVKVLELPPS